MAKKSLISFEIRPDDESKCNIFGIDNREKVCRKKKYALDSKNLVATIKHGGESIIVWGVVATSGVEKLYLSDYNGSLSVQISWGSNMHYYSQTSKKAPKEI